MSATYIGVELLAIKAAYTAMERLDGAARARILDWLRARAAEDEREASARQAKGAIVPEFWCPSGNLDYRYENRAEVVSDADMGLVNEDPRCYGSVVAIDGYAPVARVYAVPFTIGNAEGEVEGSDCEFFDTRELAEAFLAGMKEACIADAEAAARHEEPPA